MNKLPLPIYSLIAKHLDLKDDWSFLMTCKKIRRGLLEYPLRPSIDNITNSHHFCEDVTLSIDYGKLVWKVKNDKTNKIRTLEPENSIDDFVTAIKLAFEFTGVCFETSYSNTYFDYIKIETTGKMEGIDVIDYIYNYPLEHSVKFIRMSHCKCNMGCEAVIDIIIGENEYKTYGDLMRSFGMDFKFIPEDSKTYYGYPDSVWIWLERIDGLPEVMYKNNCSETFVKVKETLDPNLTYLSWEYTR